MIVRVVYRALSAFLRTSVRIGIEGPTENRTPNL